MKMKQKHIFASFVYGLSQFDKETILLLFNVTIFCTDHFK